MLSLPARRLPEPRPGPMSPAPWTASPQRPSLSAATFFIGSDVSVEGAGRSTRRTNGCSEVARLAHDGVRVLECTQSHDSGEVADPVVVEDEALVRGVVADGEWWRFASRRGTVEVQWCREVCDFLLAAEVT